MALASYLVTLELVFLMHWKRNCTGKKSNKYIFFKYTFAESREKIARFAEQVCLLFMDCIKIGILFFCSVSPNLVPLVLLLFHLRLLFSHLHAVFSWFRTLTLIPLLSLTYLFLLVFSHKSSSAYYTQFLFPSHLFTQPALIIPAVPAGRLSSSSFN